VPRFPPLSFERLYGGGERGIRNLSGILESVNCRFYVAQKAKVATLAMAPWPILAQTDVLQIETEIEILSSDNLDVDDHAAMPNSVWMNWHWPTTSPLGNRRI
jgi:hypothetical protein